MLITLPIIAGLQLKTLCAILGTVCGIIISSLIAIVFSAIMHLSGLITDEMLTVFYMSDISINLKGIMLSGMIIAALGALMDVCVSIASSAAEIFQANPAIEEKEALRSVLRIGKDILGSMVNTLILAYVGSSLSLILIIAMRIQPEMPFTMILNYNPVLSEIVKSVTGSLGMLLCIPITAFISVKLYKRRKTF
ncbi:MAG: YibE/F family protein [Leptospirales bacterium]|nr:YibE/F family protein [Leptospirales bacterium]